MRIYVAVAAFWLLSLVNSSHADLLAYEPFDYSGGELTEHGGGIGFGEDWFDYGGAPVLDAWEIKEGSLSYPGLQTDGNHIKPAITQLPAIFEFFVDKLTEK